MPLPPMISSGARSPLVGSLLFVCTGNACRSPDAERLLQHFVPRLPVAGAGIGTLVGRAMEPVMAAELERQDAMATGLVSRQVSEDDLGADLVLTITSRQRLWLLDEDPTLALRIGLLGSVPALATQLDAQHPPARAAVAAWVRRALHMEEEIPDPYQQPPPAARRAADRLDAPVHVLAYVLVRLRGRTVGPRPPQH